MFAVCFNDSFRTTHADRYAMPNTPTCRKLTPERSVTATVVNTFVSICNNLLAADEPAFLKSLGVAVLSSTTAVLSVAINLVEVATKIALLFITRILTLTCICDYIDNKPLCSNPLAQLPINIGKSAVISISTLFVGPYAALNMIFASKSLDMEKIVTYGSLGLTPRLTHCLYKG